ncbi:MAG: permease prefix domain 2-containing transporter [Pseudomonadota bacterium]
MRPRHQPPRLAVMLLRWLAPPDVRGAMLGDLAEEYQLHARRSRAAADRWFWRQVAGSAAPLTTVWLSDSVTGRWLVAGLLAALLYVWLVAWDIWVARTGAGWAAQGTGPENLLMVRLVYFQLYLCGAAIGGAMACLAARPIRQPFRASSVRLLVPLCAILLWVLANRLQTPAGQTAWAYLASRTLLTVPAVMLGMVLVRPRRQNGPNDHG